MKHSMNSLIKIVELLSIGLLIQGCVQGFKASSIQLSTVDIANVANSVATVPISNQVTNGNSTPADNTGSSRTGLGSNTTVSKPPVSSSDTLSTQPKKVVNQLLRPPAFCSGTTEMYSVKEQKCITSCLGKEAILMYNFSANVTTHTQFDFKLLTGYAFNYNGNDVVLGQMHFAGSEPTTDEGKMVFNAPENEPYADAYVNAFIQILNTRYNNNPPVQADVGQIFKIGNTMVTEILLYGTSGPVTFKLPADGKFFGTAGVTLNGQIYGNVYCHDE